MKAPKNKLELLSWRCVAGNHEVKGGARYANFDSGHDCHLHAPYLQIK